MGTTPKILLALCAVVIAGAGTGAYILLQRQPVQPAPVASPSPETAPAAPGAAPANCLLPGPAPVPPDGATASAAEMGAGHDAAQDFVHQLEGYQACRDSQADNAGPNVPQKQKDAWIAQGDDAVDEANDIASAYSVQMKIFKARTPK